MAEQYDLTKEQQKNLLEKAKRREVLRAEFLKQSSDPFRHATGEGGAVFDPALQRFLSMRVTTYDHFRPTWPRVRNGIFFLAPFFIFGYVLKTSRDAQESKYRKGEVAYKDRRFKFV